MPRLPVSMEASSDRMSPKMLPVTMVSKTLGFRRSCMAALSIYLQSVAKGYLQRVLCAWTWHGTANLLAADQDQIACFLSDMSSVSSILQAHMHIDTMLQ